MPIRKRRTLPGPKKTINSGGSTVPYVYILLFTVLTISLIFNAYLFFNTKAHVENSRQEQIIEDQIFQQSSDEKKKSIIEALAVKAVQDKEKAEKSAALRPQLVKDNAGDTKKESQGTGNAFEMHHPKNRSEDVLTPENLRLNAEFSKRVAISYKLDALNSFSHSFYTIDDARNVMTCLDRSVDKSNVIIHMRQCVPKDREIYQGPQAWLLSREGRLFTSAHGSVIYGDSEPLHTKVGQNDRCLAFNPRSTSDIANDEANMEPLTGRLVLLDCSDDEQMNHPHFFSEWKIDIDKSQLVNPSYAPHGTPFCLATTKESETDGVFNLTPCLGASEAWKTKRLHKPKTELLTDDLDLQDFAFNATRSAEIGIYRDIGDMRNAKCQARSLALAKKVPDLPKVTVILCFYNEEWYALLRSVWSVVITSPPELIDEIILVDDGSTMHHLHDMLDEYLKAFPVLKARVVRAGKRIGLIQARMLGADSSKNSPGRVLIFLDSHIEPVIGWMEPLVASIAEDRRRVLCPVIPSIAWSDLKIMGLGGSSIGIFDWDLVFRWESRKELRDSRQPGKVGLDAPARPSPKGPDSEPFDSPTMAGGLFAMDKSYFYDLGTYDDKMTYWGAENLEISFRIWMCGGILQIDPCSDVFHIFREAIGHQNTRAGDYLAINNARLAKVWLDQYQDVYFTSHPLSPSLDIGDLTDRIDLRERLQCKSFEWYLNNFMPDMFIPDDDHCQGRGEVRNVASGICLDCLGASEKKGSGTQELGVYSCHNMGGNQNFFLTLRGELRTPSGLCVDAYPPPTQTNGKRKLFLDVCHGMQGNQHFIAVPIDGFMDGTVLLKHANGRCLQLVASSSLKVDDVCNPDDRTMHWKFTKFDYSKLENVNH
jgi:polypeptide N-acetylgalactosaminyltransferase